MAVPCADAAPVVLDSDQHPKPEKKEPLIGAEFV
jgi:hypothetical protein